MKSLQPDNKIAEFLEKCAHADGVFYLGHASVLCVLNGKKVVFDPVVFSEPYRGSWTFFPDQTKDPVLLDVDAIVVSHIHQDHYDIEYLRRVTEKIDLLIIGGRPSFETDLKNHSIKFKVIPPYEATEIFPGVFIYGVLHEWNGIDSSTLIYSDKFCVYHGNDNYCEETTIKKLTQIKPAVDVACVPYAFIHWYPFLLEDTGQLGFDKFEESSRLVTQHMDFCVKVGSALNASATIPFGATLVLDDGDGFSPMNMAVKTPFEFADYVREQRPDIADKFYAMLSGDYFIKDQSELSVFRQQEYNSKSFRQAMSAFLKARERQREHRSWAPIDKLGFLDGIRSNLLKLNDFASRGIIRIELKYLGDVLKMHIDLSQNKADWVDEYDAEDSYHHFKLDEIASASWLNGHRFEEIIGMRRFTVARVPNVYDKAVLRVMSTVL